MRSSQRWKHSTVSEFLGGGAVSASGGGEELGWGRSPPPGRRVSLRTLQLGGWIQRRNLGPPPDTASPVTKFPLRDRTAADGSPLSTLCLCPWGRLSPESVSGWRVTHDRLPGPGLRPTPPRVG